MRLWQIPIEDQKMHYKKIISAKQFAEMTVEQRSRAITDHQNYSLDNSVHLWAKQNPAQWEEARNHSGRLGDSHATKVAELQAVLDGPERKIYTREEQDVLHEFPESEVRKYYTPANSGEASQYDLSALKRNAPAKAFRIETAAHLYGLKTSAPTRPAEPKPVAPPVATLTNEQCDTLSLPHGTKATTEELIEYLANIEKIKAKSAEQAK
jgi:hypothetical protein